MYKDMPYLWRKDHSDYMNKDVRAEGFKVLLEIYKNFDEKATIKTIKKKIENMRTNYAKELKKVCVFYGTINTTCMAFIIKLIIP